MNDSQSAVREIRNRSLRVIIIASSLFGLALLVTAGVLSPSKHGRGTHRQLGLPPCGVLAFYGRPCPSCGMTTSWSNLMRVRFVESVNANPAGAWLGAWTLVLSIWGLASACRGRWMFIGPNQWFFLVLVTFSLLFVLTVWVIRFFF